MLGAAVGTVSVATAENRGFTAEEIAERCLNRIIQVSDEAPEVIRQQALAYKAHLYYTLVQYMREMAVNERTTVSAELEKNGYNQAAELVRRL